jgi:hypothetical protein
VRHGRDMLRDLHGGLARYAPEMACSRCCTGWWRGGLLAGGMAYVGRCMVGDSCTTRLVMV